jgi:hypothetical protein
MQIRFINRQAYLANSTNIQSMEHAGCLLWFALDEDNLQRQWYQSCPKYCIAKFPNTGASGRASQTYAHFIPIIKVVDKEEEDEEAVAKSTA